MTHGRIVLRCTTIGRIAFAEAHSGENGVGVRFSNGRRNYKKGKVMITVHDACQSEQRYFLKSGEPQTMPQDTSSAVPADPKQVAEYSASMLASLRDMAADSGLTFLAYLIQVAVEEAKIQAAGDPFR